MHCTGCGLNGRFLYSRALAGSLGVGPVNSISSGSFFFLLALGATNPLTFFPSISLILGCFGLKLFGTPLPKPVGDLSLNMLLYSNKVGLGSSGPESEVSEANPELLMWMDVLEGTFGGVEVGVLDVKIGGDVLDNLEGVVVNPAR